jgi:hypothetical protein
VRAAALVVVGVALVAGVVLGLSLSTVPVAAGPVTPTDTNVAPSTTTRSRTCIDVGALVPAYTAFQGGDSRSTVRPGSVRCAGSYAVAKIDDPSLPDPLSVLFAVSPVRALREGTGPICEVGSGEGGLPAITVAQGTVLNCA